MALQTEKMIFETTMRFVADADTDENYFGIDFSQQMQTQLLFAALRGPHSR